MEAHNKKLDPKEITVNGAIDYFYDGINEIHARIHGGYLKKQEDALKEAILSCGYHYDEITQDLKQNRIFLMRFFRYGSCNKNKEYVLYDREQKRAFVLITESTEYSSVVESNDRLARSITFKIQAHKNKEVPYNYHR